MYYIKTLLTNIEIKMLFFKQVNFFMKIFEEKKYLEDFFKV